MDTYTHILDLSEALIKSSGYHGFSYADIARALNISKPSVHHHFPTKASLALASVTRYRAHQGAALTLIDARSPSIEEALEALGTIFTQGFLGEGHGCLCASLTADWNSLPEDVRVEVKLYWADAQNWIAAHISRAYPEREPARVQEMAMLIFSLYEGVMMSARLTQDAQLFEQATRAAIALVTTV